LYSLGQDKFPPVIDINIGKIEFEEMGDVIKQASWENIVSMGPKEAYVFFVKMFRYETVHFDKTYELNKHYKGDTFKYKITNKETDVEAMRIALWNIVEELQQHINKTNKEVMGRAMGMFSEILSSPGIVNILGPQGFNIPSNVKIEEVHEFPALTEKEKDILDEINQLEGLTTINDGLTVNDSNALTAADDPVVLESSNEKNELEKTLEEAGHL